MTFLLIKTAFFIAIGFFGLMWILGNVKSETIKTTAIIVFGFSFIYLVVKTVIEVLFIGL